MYYPDINSLRDLDASGLPILSTSNNLIDLFDNDNDNDDDDVDSTSFMQNLRKKMQFTFTNAIRSTAHNRNISALARKSFFPIIAEELIDADGGPLLHLVEECPGTKNVTSICRNSYYISTYTKYIRR